jgi:uncharacterized protein
MEVTIFGEELELLPQRAIWWKAQKILLVADMHLGKINHFRKAGIPVPAKANDRNWETLIELVQVKNPERMICIGDLFHSHYNSDWEMVGQFTNHFTQLSFELITGNHDILSDHQYMRNRVVVHPEKLTINSFVLSHFPVDDREQEAYTLSGHLHPGIQIHGKGRQAVTLPCFYFGERQGYLPAFGMFTGLARIQPAKEDSIFAIAEEAIIKL